MRTMRSRHRVENLVALGVLSLLGGLGYLIWTVFFCPRYYTVHFPIPYLKHDENIAHVTLHIPGGDRGLRQDKHSHATVTTSAGYHIYCTVVTGESANLPDMMKYPEFYTSLKHLATVKMSDTEYTCYSLIGWDVSTMEFRVKHYALRDVAGRKIGVIATAACPVAKRSRLEATMSKVVRSAHLAFAPEDWRPPDLALRVKGDPWE